MKEAVLKYCQGGVLEMSRPAVIDASKSDPNELDQVSAVKSSRKDMLAKCRVEGVDILFDMKNKRES